MQPIATHGGEVMYFECVFNCDDICMCVMNKKFELLEFVLIPLTCSMRFLSLLLQGMRACVVSVILWSSLVCL